MAQIVDTLHYNTGSGQQVATSGTVYASLNGTGAVQTTAVQGDGSFSFTGLADGDYHVYGVTTVGGEDLTTQMKVYTAEPEGGGGPTTLLEDTFSGTAGTELGDGTSGTHAPDTGPAWQLAHIHDTNLQQIGELAGLGNAFFPLPDNAVIADLGVSDCVIEADCNLSATTDGRVVIIIRHNGAADTTSRCWAVGVRLPNGDAGLRGKLDADPTDIGSINMEPYAPASNIFTMRAEVSGNTLTFFVDDDEIGVYDISSALTTETHFGFGILTSDTDTLFSAIRITDS